MREIFLESFLDDTQKVFEERLKSNDEYYNKTKDKAYKLSEEFWNILTKEQQDKYREFEIAKGAEQVILDEDLYAYAIKKGMAIGFEIGRSFK